MSGVILAVDDSESIRQMVRHTLEHAGYSVVQAADGAAALDYAKKKGADLVLTDINMPNLDGIALCKELRNLPHYKGVPILMLTTESEPDMKVLGKQAGATGWLVKPFNPSQLLATLARVL